MQLPRRRRLDVGCAILQRQRVEVALRVLEHVANRRELNRMVRIRGTEAHARPAGHHRLAEPERHGDDAVLGAHRRSRIEIVRPRDARNVRIEPVVVVRADDPLKDHRHLLFLEPVRRRPNVGLRARREHRRVHALDGARQLAQPYFRLGMAVRQHVRLVHAGERLILRVFE